MKLTVRVNPGARAETFRRCGLAFTRQWLTVDVDEATAAALFAEQMLEVAAAAQQDGGVPEAPTPATAPKPKKPARNAGGTTK